MTKQTTSGVLGWLNDPETMARDRERLTWPAEETPKERQAIEARFEAAIDAGLKALREKYETGQEAELDRDFRELYERFYGVHLAERVRTSGTKTHAATFKRFAQFCEQLSADSQTVVRCLPAKMGVVAAYLHLLIEQGVRIEKIRKELASISWAHGLRELHDPTDTDLIRAMLSSRQKPKLNGAAVNHEEHPHQ